MAKEKVNKLGLGCVTGENFQRDKTKECQLPAGAVLSGTAGVWCGGECLLELAARGRTDHRHRHVSKGVKMVWRSVRCEGNRVEQKWLSGRHLGAGEGPAEGSTEPWGGRSGKTLGQRKDAFEDPGEMV